MRLVRAALLVGTFAAVLGIIALAHKEMRAYRVDAVGLLVAGSIVFMLCLNFYYLLVSNPGSPPSSWRLARLVRLWFEAKEKDLQRRASSER